MNFFAMRIQADLYLLDVEFAEATRLFFANEDRVGLELDVEAESAGVLDDFEAVGANQRLAAADGQEEHAGCGELIENMLDFGGGHFAVAGVIEIAVFAALVAAIGDVEMDAQRYTVKHGALIEIGHQAH